jgi:hypothetical protein
MKLMMNRAFFVPVLVGQLAFGTVACSGANDVSDPTSESSASTHAQAYDGQTIFRAVFFNQGAAADKAAAMWVDRPEVAAGKSSEEVATLLDRAADEMASQSYSDASVKMVRDHAESLRSGATTPADLKSKGAIGAVADAIVAHIEKSNPSMFASFQEEMQSGDPLRVKATLSSAAKTFLEAHAQLTQEAAVRSPDVTVTPIKIRPPIYSPGPIFNPTPINNPTPIVNPIGDDLVVVDTAAVIYAAAVVAVAAVVVAVVVAMPPGGLGGGVESDLVVGHLTQSFAR